MKPPALLLTKAAQKTKDYVAHFGRAKNLGREGRAGIPDPGSVSVSIIFKAFAQSAQEVELMADKEGNILAKNYAFDKPADSSKGYFSKERNTLIGA